MSLTTMAVLDMAIAAPNTTAPCQVRSQGSCQKVSSLKSSKWPSKVPNTMTNTWAMPKPNTIFFRRKSLGRLNSRPMTNISSTTPISAKEATTDSFS